MCPIRRHRRRRRPKADGTVIAATPLTASSTIRPEAHPTETGATESPATQQLTNHQVNLVIPFVTNKLRPEVRELGELLDAEFADLTGDDQGYFKVVAKLWTKGESFLLLEHDVLATPALLQEMWDCPHEWCHAFAWRYSGPVMPGESRPQHPIRQRETALFCHKVSGSLLQRMGAIPRGPVRWTQVDFLLLGWLAQNALAHLHGPVLHLHQQHPAWAATMTEKDWANA